MANRRATSIGGAIDPIGQTRGLLDESDRTIIEVPRLGEQSGHRARGRLGGKTAWFCVQIGSPLYSRRGNRRMLWAVVRGLLSFSLITTGTRKGIIAFDRRLACPRPSATPIGYLVQIVGAGNRPRLPSWHDDPGALLMGMHFGVCLRDVVWRRQRTDQSGSHAL